MRAWQEGVDLFSGLFAVIVEEGNDGSSSIKRDISLEGLILGHIASQVDRLIELRELFDVVLEEVLGFVAKIRICFFSFSLNSLYCLNLRREYVFLVGFEGLFVERSRHYEGIVQVFGLLFRQLFCWRFFSNILFLLVELAWLSHNKNIFFVGCIIFFGSFIILLRLSLR